MKLSVRIQQRDLNLMRDLGQSRFLTYSQLADLWFSGSIESARKRVLKLRQAGLLTAHQPAFHQPILLMLSRAGASYLTERGIQGHLHPSVFDIPGTAILEHELALRDLKVRISRLAQIEGSEIEEFSVLSQQLAFFTKAGLVRPDAYIRLKSNSALMSTYFFIELDQGTESLDRLEWKVLQYWTFYREGGFANRMGLNRESYKRAPFRIILTFRSITRLRNISERLLRKGFHSFVCVAVASDFASKGSKTLESILKPLGSM